MKQKQKGKHQGGKRASQTKLQNKKMSKLAKQGKLRKKKKNHSMDTIEVGDEVKDTLAVKKVATVQEDDVEDELSDEDMDYFSTPGRNASFVSNANTSLLSEATLLPTKKRKREADDPEKDYEKIPRKLLAKDEENIKHVLPIKTKSGIVPQMIKDLPQEDVSNGPKVEDEVTEATIEESCQETLPQLTSIQMYAVRRQKLANRKEKMAVLASSIIENPEQSMRKLKELRLMLEENDPDVMVTVRKLGMVSLMEVFKDIIPGYRLRLATEKEKQQKAKKETKDLRDYEEAFLRNYKHYLEFLERCAKGKLNQAKKFWYQKKENDNHVDIPQEGMSGLRHTAVMCLCQILTTHPHFNYTNNIITVIVPFMNNSDKELSCLTCDAIRQVFREDRAGYVSLEVVRYVGKMVKSRNFHVKRQVLDVFLSLRIKEIDLKSEATKPNAKQRREEMKKLSKREKKKKKRMEQLERELQETKATEDKKRRMKLHTEIIQAVFLTYFRILKAKKHSVLLSAVLEGLAKFAHLISVDFFDDLFTVFNELIESQELTYRESLHCVQTAFTILSGQGAALNIDPNKFYCHLYKSLFNVHAGNSSEDIPIILNCLDAMLTRRKRQVSQQRVLAFIKRLCSISLLQTHQGALSLLSAVRSFMLTYKSSELLFDNETQGSGMFLPELPDPEHSNTHNTMLWELPLLQHHYHPVVRRFTSHLCHMAPTAGDGQLPPELSRKSPLELYKEFEMKTCELNPEPPKTCKVKQKNIHFKGKQSKSFLSNSIDSMATKVLQSIPDEPPEVIK